MNWAAEAGDQSLTKCGQVQAAGAAKALKIMPQRPPVMKIISSTLIRAEQTAIVIQEKFPEIPLQYDAELVEGNPDLPYIQLRFERVYKKYFVPSQGPKQTWILVCHSNLIRYLVCRYS